MCISQNYILKCELIDFYEGASINNPFKIIDTICIAQNTYW